MKLALALLFILVVSLPVEASCWKRKNVRTPAPFAPVEVQMKEGWNEAFADVFRVLCKNLKTPNTLFRGYRAHPGPNYHGAYLWDSAFIMQVWMYWDPFTAQKLVPWILKFQKKNGLLPHVVAELVVKPVRLNDSQPPLLSWSSWRVYERTQDKDFLRQIYPGLKKFQEFLVRERRHPDGLYFWKTPYESGIDNSPRFTDRKESYFDDTTKLASVDMSSYVALSAESLAKMASVLGLPEDEMSFRRQYQDIRDAVNAKLWSEEDGTYYDWDYRTSKFVRFNTISNFTPMIAGLPDHWRALRLMQQIQDPGLYNTLVPFPSVARNDPLFVKDMWRGPVWINMAYLGVLGMDRYGHRKEAAEYAHRIVQGVYETWKNTGEFYEFYDPDRFDIKELTRKKGNWWKELTLGKKPVRELVGWTGLANTLVFEYGADW